MVFNLPQNAGDAAEEPKAPTVPARFQSSTPAVNPQHSVPAPNQKHGVPAQNQQHGVPATNNQFNNPQPRRASPLGANTQAQVNYTTRPQAFLVGAMHDVHQIQAEKLGNKHKKWEGIRTKVGKTAQLTGLFGLIGGAAFAAVGPYAFSVAVGAVAPVVIPILAFGYGTRYLASYLHEKKHDRDISKTRRVVNYENSQVKEVGNRERGKRELGRVNTVYFDMKNGAKIDKTQATGVLDVLSDTEKRFRRRHNWNSVSNDVAYGLTTAAAVAATVLVATVGIPIISAAAAIAGGGMALAAAAVGAVATVTTLHKWNKQHKDDQSEREKLNNFKHNIDFQRDEVNKGHLFTENYHDIQHPDPKPLNAFVENFISKPIENYMNEPLEKFVKTPYRNVMNFLNSK